jgi:hypothetical protein
MNERIEKLAIEAGLESVSDDLFYASNENLERFAELVRQEEREACAKLCEEQYEYYGYDHIFAAKIRGRTE